jgi:signal transduction histidine kinase
MEHSNSLPISGIRISQPWMARYAVWLLSGSTGLLVVISFGLGLTALLASDGELNPFTHLFFLPFITTIYGLTGWLITRQQPHHIIGWLLLIVGVCSALTLFSGAYAEFAHFVTQSESGFMLDLCLWLDKWVWVIPSVLPLTGVLLLFPDGGLPSPRWRWLAWLIGVGIAGVMVGAAFYPEPLPDYGLPERNPYGIAGSEAALGFVLNSASGVLLLSVLGSFAAVIVRFRAASGVQRIQLKWLLFAAALVLVALIATAVLWLVFPDDPVMIELGIIVTSGGVALIIAAIGIAMLRHQLWDVDVLINRSLVYGLLMLIVIGMYVLTVSFLSMLFDGETLLFSLVATGVVAVSFQALREAVQDKVSVLLFGHRDDPYRVLQHLTEQLEPITAAHEALPAIVGVITDALRLPYAAILVRHGGRDELAAVYPASDVKSRPSNAETFPLVYQAETIGQLVLAPRSRDESFSTSELVLLDTIARQVAIAAYNVRLTEDLQRSREQIVTAREEERRRLRRDLHDGLGPVLAAMSFRLDAIHNFIEHDPDQARKLTGELKAQVQSSLSEIRRIAYNLRPPALDGLGLLGALREHLTSAQQHDGLHFVLENPEALPPLPAAVEVAAYRIITEAVTNVQRHAEASICTIKVDLDEQSADLRLEVIDNGRGIPTQPPAGVGLAAMRERTAELGGQFFINSSADAGTRIQARLPVYIDGKS